MNSVDLVLSSAVTVPAILADAGPRATEGFLEFFAAQIRNPHTRSAYLRAATQFFGWCDERRIPLEQLRPLHVAAYIEEKQHRSSAPSVKQHLAALRVLFDWLVVQQVLPSNPAWHVRGPRFSRRTGVTPILEAAQVRTLLNSIDLASVAGLRDRALIAVMAYTFARASAVAGLRRGDYLHEGKRSRLLLHEKGGKERKAWLHREASEFLEAYLATVGELGAGEPLFQTVTKAHRLTGRAISRGDLLRLVKRRCQAAGLPGNISNHSFRGTGITVFLENGGSLEAAQEMANHADPRTTKLYDRRAELATLGEIERRLAF